MRSRPDSGLANARTVTRFGISWARTGAARSARKATGRSQPGQRSITAASIRRGSCRDYGVTTAVAVDGERRNRCWRPSPTQGMDMRIRTAVIFSVVGVVVAGLAVGQSKLQAAIAARAVDAPRFEVDPLWPKPLPNHWVLGSTIGVGIDSRDHVFIIHRGDSTLNQRTEVGANAKPAVGECCRSAPPILEFDPEGNLVKAWGGPSEG